MRETESRDIGTHAGTTPTKQLKNAEQQVQDTESPINGSTAEPSQQTGGRSQICSGLRRGSSAVKEISNENSSRPDIREALATGDIQVTHEVT